MIYKADLHIHSCLSPCASLDMSPRAIVERAAEIGLNCLALTDHNSAGNCATMAKFCEREGILFFPGLEVMSAEEAHFVCLFDDVDTATAFGKIIYDSLTPVKNIPEKMGDQVYVDEDDGVVDFEEQYLGIASGYTVDCLRERVAYFGGLFIAAHVDKPCFSITSRLGSLNGEFSAVELSRAGALRGGYEELTKDYTAITASDSHYIHNIGGACIEFESDTANIAGFARSLREGRIKMSVFDDAFRTEPGRRIRT
ncbi:MAG: PHP domain-containing protein [Chitinispirillales bacterium]|jgi:PHP family Zn ribbon phosphoesterase|nr:PHP domain-containing protein [Chitinispirillales bacterium]